MLKFKYAWITCLHREIAKNEMIENKLTVLLNKNQTCIQHNVILMFYVDIIFGSILKFGLSLKYSKFEPFRILLILSLSEGKLSHSSYTSKNSSNNIQLSSFDFKNCQLSAYKNIRKSNKKVSFSLSWTRISKRCQNSAHEMKKKIEFH